MLSITELSTPWGGISCIPYIPQYKFSGITSNGSAYNVKLHGSTVNQRTISVASGMTYDMVTAPTSMYCMFESCSKLTSLDVSNFDTSQVTNMGWMFAGCSGLTSLDVSNFDTSKVTYIDGMFYGCSKLNSLDVSNFDTSNVTNMSRMFYFCQSLTSIDVSDFDTSKVTTMWQMFQNCSKLTSLDVSNFDTSKVTNMDGMFSICSSLRYITLGENFFKATVNILFDGAENLGFNEDNSDNGWLEHLATVAPQQTELHTIQLHSNLKNASWTAPHLATLQSKGYTIV